MSDDQETIERPHFGVLIVVVAAALAAAGWYFYGQWGSRIQRLHWPDGSLRRESRVIRHPVHTWIEDGPYVTWFEGGVQKAEEGVMKNSSLHGKLTQWHTNGVKKSESEWSEGRMVGKPLQWDEQGNPEVVPDGAPPPQPVVF